MSAKIQVLQFVTSFKVGGTERHVANLVRHHDAARFDVHIGCLSNAGTFLGELPDLGDRVEEYPIRRLYGPNTWRQQARLARYLRARRVQVVHAYGFYSNCFAIPAAAIARVPVIIGSIRDIGASWTSRQRTAERWICKLAHSLTTNADAVKQKLVEEGYRPEEIVVIRNGIDLERCAAPQRRSAIRTDLGIPEDAPLVGVIARIQSVKGLEYFIDAAPLVLRNLAEARFVIVGGPFPNEAEAAYFQTLKDRVRHLGVEDRMLFAGSRDDIPGVFRELAVSVLPSLTEGLPNVVLESMAAGTPVVATAVGGIPEVIKGGENGLLVPSRNREQLAGAIERLLRDPQLSGRLAARARADVFAEFSVERMARSTEEHYLELLRESTAGVAREAPSPISRGSMRKRLL